MLSRPRNTKSKNVVAMEKELQICFEDGLNRQPLKLCFGVNSDGKVYIRKTQWAHSLTAEQEYSLLLLLQFIEKQDLLQHSQAYHPNLHRPRGHSLSVYCREDQNHWLHIRHTTLKHLALERMNPQCFAILLHSLCIRILVVIVFWLMSLTQWMDLPRNRFCNFLHRA